MIAAWALIVGGLLRIVGEVLEIIAGGHTVPSGAIAGGALLLVMVGFAGLWPEARTSRLARLAIVAVGLGALGFAGIAAWSVSQGALPVGTVSRLPAFIAAAAVTLVGALALAAWLIGSGFYPVWIGIVMTVSIAMSLVSSFVAFPALVQPLIDLVMALTFIQLGLSMRERRKTGNRI
ncbi:hypothetical protein [Pelagibacterium halotolerans]|uniref:Uncharacterized protein n=1 Tax=Pelagibacterium halotolerans (strain DSM 22347 / JCM 15775 / CGMCC 1.7692 / B2) TaxID=1082931 RepID=G4R6V9_PELHB|nr:hypothetical protein [Pelagibacterium halotolerans]AEQ53232.1 hypothetical protein KKY_3244 [Pelagibacterium halotolerans B2]QJR17137.1 hypothetical protein HKM20_00860 [Pelagibacterium halotolerans]SEA96333.1 hypothetical protein SAMN05428936_11523 [Pelagibacterium halotolerans]